jgi:hypothetical protein
VLDIALVLAPALVLVILSVIVMTIQFGTVFVVFSVGSQAILFVAPVLNIISGSMVITLAATSSRIGSKSPPLLI